MALCVLDGGELAPASQYVFKSQVFRSIYTGRNIFRCTRCGLRQIDVSRVNNAALTKYYQYDYRNVAKIGTATGETGKRYYQARGRALASLIVGQPSSVFELGSGYGFNLTAVKERFPEVRLVTDEIDTSMAITAERGSLQEGPYDVIMLSHVLEHFTDPVQLLRDAGAAVAPGGTMIIEVPNDVEGIYPLNGPDEPHITFFTEATLRQAITTAGLTPERVFAAGFDNRFKTLKNRMKRAVRGLSTVIKPLGYLLSKRSARVLKDVDISGPNPRGSVLRAVISF